MLDARVGSIARLKQDACSSATLAIRTDDQLGAKLQAQRKQALRGARRKVDHQAPLLNSKRRVAVPAAQPQQHVHSSELASAIECTDTEPVDGSGMTMRVWVLLLHRHPQNRPAGSRLTRSLPGVCAYKEGTLLDTLMQTDWPIRSWAHQASNRCKTQSWSSSTSCRALCLPCSTPLLCMQCRVPRRATHSPAQARWRTDWRCLGLSALFPCNPCHRHRVNHGHAVPTTPARGQGRTEAHDMAPALCAHADCTPPATRCARWFECIHRTLPTADHHGSVWLVQLQQEAVQLMEDLNLLHLGDPHGKGVRPLFERFVRQPYGRQ